jgi:phage shock protein PspC (stress-responsive transcriptional regulator)
MNSNTSPSTRSLMRSTSDRKLTGVAGGLAAYFGVDPVIVRVAFGVTTLFGGAGAVAYLALLALVPTDDGRPAPLGPRPVAA